MAGYLKDYGVEDERRSKFIKRLVLSIVAILVISGAVHLAFRSFTAKRKVQLFLENLNKKDYRAAYELWGCTKDSPCKDYTFDKFMEDWGPKSPYGDTSQARLASINARTCNPGAIATLKTIAAHALGEKGCNCGTGVIHQLSLAKGENVAIWYDSKEKALGFSPFPVCVPSPRAFQ